MTTKDRKKLKSKLDKEIKKPGWGYKTAKILLPMIEKDLK